jgi:membrane protein DedA with SNARE-associated domain
MGDDGRWNGLGKKGNSSLTPFNPVKTEVMQAILQFVLHHGYTVLVGIVFAEQIGIPIPAAPYLLAVGALAAYGALSFKLALLAGIGAAISADLIWYELGRRNGSSMLRLLCRISLEPDSCVRRTESLFERHGAWSLIYAKFVPGLGTVAPPLAGMLRLPLLRFIAMDALGSLLWTGAFTGLGYLFGEQLEVMGKFAVQLGSGMTALLVGSIALWLGLKLHQRRRFFARLRTARISPEELKRRLDAGEAVTIIDLRHDLISETDNVKLPGALHITPEELERRAHEIPGGREFILYCT